MKSKKALFILVPALVFIWGTIAYKIITATSDNDNLPSVQSYQGGIAKETLKKDTFSLQLNYRDPFLGTQRWAKKKTSSVKSNQKATETAEKEVQWPDIVYGGMIRNKKSAKQLALIKINQQDNIFKPGEERREVTLVRITADSVLLQYQDKVKTFYK